MRLTLAATALLALTAAADAQQQKSVTSAFSGFSTKSDEPVNVESDNLEVKDADQTAIFTGNVIAKQGDSTLRTHKLTVYYYDKNNRPKPGANAQKPQQGETKAPEGANAPETGRDIRKMEADGDVVVTQKDQKATGAHGVFDTQANTADLTGGVVVTQGDNVVRGDRLHVDMNTSTSRIEGAGSGGGRVQSVFKPKPKDGQNANSGAKH